MTTTLMITALAAATFAVPAMAAVRCIVRRPIPEIAGRTLAPQSFA